MLAKYQFSFFLTFQQYFVDYVSCTEKPREKFGKLQELASTEYLSRCQINVYQTKLISVHCIQPATLVNDFSSFLAALISTVLHRLTRSNELPQH